MIHCVHKTLEHSQHPFQLALFPSNSWECVAVSMFQESFPIGSFQAATQFYRLRQLTSTDVCCSMWSASVAGNIQFTNREVGLFACEILFLNLFWLHLLLQLFFGTLYKQCLLPFLKKFSFQTVKMAKQKRFNCEHIFCKILGCKERRRKACQKL